MTISTSENENLKCVDCGSEDLQKEERYPDQEFTRMLDGEHKLLRKPYFVAVCQVCNHIEELNHKG